MESQESLAWFDGELRPLSEIRVSPLSHSLHYGTGVFEGIRAYEQDGGGGGVFRLPEHVDRLLSSARILGVEVPWSAEQLVEAALAVLRAGGLAEAYVRPLVWLGEGDMGVAGEGNPVHTMIAAWPWGAYLGDEGLRKGVAVAITGYERATGNAVAQRAKVTGQYVTSFMALRQVRAQGLAEGILLDRDGYLAEATGENLFLARRGVLTTPPDDSPILLGITRESVLQLALDAGLEVRYGRPTRTDLYDADEAFLTGTAAELTPIREVDGRALRHSPGPLTRRLQDAYLGVVRGRGERAAEWVTRF